MRILLITQWFDPEPCFKGLLFAKALQRRGHSVQVLTGFPNYPGGKVYPGYRICLWQRQVMGGIPILRVALYPSHDRSAIGRILNYFSFAISSSILGPIMMKKADVAYVYHPPATIGFAAFTLKYLRGIPIVYDVQDLWPDTLAATGMIKNRLLLRIIGWGCRFIYRFVDRIVVLSAGFKTQLMEIGVPAERISLIYNWTYPMAPKSVDIEFSRQMEGKYVVLFAGNLGIAQGLDTALDASKLLRDRHPEVCFVFAGSGMDEERLRRRSQDEGMSNVVFLPRRPADEMGSLYGRADALLVHLRDEPLFSKTIPSKTQTYLAVGKPILMGVRGDAAEIVKKAGAGIVFPPQDSAALVKAIETLLSTPEAELLAWGVSGRKFYDANFSEEAGVTAFEKVLTLVAGIKTNGSKEC